MVFLSVVEWWGDNTAGNSFDAAAELVNTTRRIRKPKFIELGLEKVKWEIEKG